MPTLSQMLGSQFGGKTYTSSFFGVRLDFGPRQTSGSQSPFTPSAPSPTPSQQILPTSKFGDTIPVVWGICRVPGSYIWAPGFEEGANDDGEIIKTLKARIRFARPLVADSNWALRRVWSNGKLIYRGSAPKYRSRGLSRLRAYDGQSTQGRDDLQVSIEGEDNVSAHRGYLDMVITVELTGDDKQPPSFDAEWIQDATSSIEVDPFESFISDPVDTNAALVGSTGRWWGITDAIIRQFDTDALHEIIQFDITGQSRAYNLYDSLRYIDSLDLLLTTGFKSGAGDGGTWPLLIDPSTGAIVAEADLRAGTISQTIRCDLAITWGSQGIYILAMHSNNIVCTYSYTAASMTRLSVTGTDWDSRGEVQCITLGEQRSGDADIFVCCGDKLYRASVTTAGAITGISALATFADNPLYAVYYEEDVVVWDDGGNVTKVDGSTGSTIWTTTTPYTLQDALLRGLGEPDKNILIDELYVQGTTDYWFTSLEDGSTRTVDKVTETSAWKNVYDGSRDVAINTDNGGSTISDSPLRRLFDAIGDGATRDLEDFVAAVWEADDGFGASDHVEVGYSSDQIKGAVIDITTGKRAVVRSVAGPYSFSIFERSATIITKRALTDGSFVVDASLAANDFADRGGQAIRATKLNTEEFIARYGIVHRDPDAIYQSVTQWGEIQFTPYPVSPTDLSAKVDVPVIHTATAMKTLATQKVRRMAEERHEFAYTLRAKYLTAEPEDVQEFSYAGRTITSRVGETTINPNFTIDVRSTEFLSRVETTVEGSTYTPIEPEEVGNPESTYYHLDIPIQQDGDDLSSTGLVQYHVLTSQGQTNWDGATLYRQDGTYVGISSQIVDGVVGVALSALPDTDNPYVTEFTRTLNVSFITGDTSTLATKTYLEVMNGANKFAIGAPGRWEVCQVIEIDDNGDGTFTLTGFVRGRGVSEEHTGSHAIGDFVVYLSGGNVQHVDYTLSDLNDAFNFKAVGSGGLLSTTPAVSRTVTGEAEKIPKPAQLNASIDSPSDVRLSWVRRARFGAIWADDGSDVGTTPLNETLEQYVVRIKDGPGGTVVRTVTVDDATFYDYSGALQITDLGGALGTGDEITFDIRQVSGSGVTSPTREATITL